MDPKKLEKRVKRICGQINCLRESEGLNVPDREIIIDIGNVFFTEDLSTQGKYPSVPQMIAEYPPNSPSIYDVFRTADYYGSDQIKTKLTRLRDIAYIAKNGWRHSWGLDHQPRNPKEGFSSSVLVILALPVDLLYEGIADDFFEGYIEDIAKTSPTTQSEPRARTANAIFFKAASALRRLILTKEHRNLHETIIHFCQSEQLPVGKPVYKALPIDKFGALLEDLCAKRPNDPIRIVASIAMLAGLRRGEIAASTSFWISDATEVPCLNVQSGFGFTTKNYKSRSARTVAPLLKYLSTFSLGKNYLIGNTKHERIAAINSTVKFLRNYFPDANNPLHELRRYYYTGYLYTNNDPLEIAQSLGHSTINVAANSYFLNDWTDEHSKLWSQSAMSLTMTAAC